MPELDVTDLTVEYASGDYSIKPIDRLSFQATSGSIVLLLGPSGCGKTTMLSCLAGILKPTSGKITFGDFEVTRLTGRDLTRYRRHVVGIIFQAFNLVPSLPAVENVAAPLWACGVPGAQARKRALELLERVGMADRSHHRPGDLSGGQQQRVAIARSLALDPPLILADEPTAHLDYVQVEAVLRLIGELATEGRTIAVATHDERLLPLADKVVELVPKFVSEELEPQVFEMPAGQEFFQQGARGNRIFILEQGSVELVRRHPDGVEEVLTTVSPGEYFGEMGPLFSLPRSATARARVASVATGYTIRDFRQKIGIDRLIGLFGTRDDGTRQL